VKIIVYTDFQCGACERFHSRVEPELRARYVAAGKAQIEMRLLGTLGEESLRAAEATLCAAEQGLFLEYQEALFRACPEGDADTYSKEELVRLAGSLGLDTETFRQTFESRSKRPEIQKNLSMANADGVYTLPAVLINGVKIEGYKPFAVYTQAMEQALGNISSQ
jgi:protein-disulfide isomerase